MKPCLVSVADVSAMMWVLCEAVSCYQLPMWVLCEAVSCSCISGWCECRVKPCLYQLLMWVLCKAVSCISCWCECCVKPCLVSVANVSAMWSRVLYQLLMWVLCEAVVDCRLSELAAVVHEQSRPQSALSPALLMACDDVKCGHTTSLGFYAG